MKTYDNEELRDLLEFLHDKYNRPEFIVADPISIPHRFTSQGDREVSGFFVSTIAWGNRKAIVKSASRMMELMDNAPEDFVVNASAAEVARLGVFVHRTFNGDDFIEFVNSIRRIYSVHGSIGSYFRNAWADSGDMRIVLSRFRKDFFTPEQPHRCGKHLSSIDKGSACKRLNMYLRWMVRSDSRGVDFGMWNDIPMSALFLPVDVHAGNMGRALGLLSRKQNDWKAVEEITEALRTFDVSDPVKYDYSLFGAGISGFLK